MAEKIINNIKLPNGEVCKIGGASGFELFDTVLKDHILTYEQSKGWALQGTYVYKDAVAGSRYGYPDFYNKCVEEFENSSNSQTYLKSNVTKVGSLVDNQGVLSGFSSSSYAYIPNEKQNNNAEYVIKFTTGATLTTSQVIFHSEEFVNIETNANGQIYSYSWGDGSSNIIINNPTPNTTYWIKLIVNGNTKTFSYSTNGVTYTEAVSFVDSGLNVSAGYQLCFGINTKVYVNPFLGTIDLNECYINVNGQRFWNGTDTITKNPNGHLFYDISEKDKIDELYNTNGIAWYYGIDKENERIFLPRTKWFIQPSGEITEVNTVNEAGLPNIEGEVGRIARFITSFKSGAFNASLLDQGNWAWAGVNAFPSMDIYFNASDSNSIYGNSDTVQPPSINQLLYICVGNTNVESAVTGVFDITTTENDTVPLFTGQYFDFKPNNVSWLNAGEQANSGGIYTFTYNELVNILNGETKYGDLKVINVADMEVGVDYSLYWKVNQEDMTFITPTAISNKALSGGVMGNGMTLGLTDGNTNYGLRGTTNVGVISAQALFGTNISDDTSVGAEAAESLGVTTDPTKSGIIAEQSTSQLYFKVANAVQNLELLDAGEVLEAVNNVVPNNSSLIAGYGLPDYANVKIISANTEYVAPYNCFVSVTGAIHGYLTVLLVETNFRVDSSSNSSYQNISTSAYVPVGVKYKIEYTSSSGTPNLWCYEIPLIGEK